MGTPLGDFIRARRDDTRPEDLELASSGRRRAPGLRRTELAMLAGISVEYLTRIEQGRDRHPSSQVVFAIADALQLDAAERDHLHTIAKVSADTCLGATPPGTEVRSAVRALLDQLEPGIALVTNRVGDVLAHTTGFDRLARPIGVLDAAQPNLTRFVFLDGRARSVYPDWDSIADQRAFELWRGPTAERGASLIAELTAAAGEEFTRRHNRHTVPRARTQRWLHPDVGELRLDCEVLGLPASDRQQLMVLLPADDQTSAALDRLHRSTAGTLRAVR